jgi:hypothetical protein
VQHLTYAFHFIKACFSLALKNTRLRNPWLAMWMGSLTLIILWLLPLGVVVALIGLKPWGMVLIGLFSILLLFCLVVWGEITALETCQIFAVLTKDDSSTVEAVSESMNFAHWGDIFLWVLTLPGHEAIHLFNFIFRPQKAVNHDWLEGSYLVLPIISLENLNLAVALERVKQMLRDHLLRFHPDLVGIRPVAGVVQWSLVIVGGLLGFWVGLIIADPLTAGILTRLLAIVVGIFLAGTFATLGVFFSSFFRACYYTTLYQWVLNVESARSTGGASQGLPPPILSQVMGKTKPSKKER